MEPLVPSFDIAAERTTALTDALIALVVVGGTLSLRRAVPATPARRLWSIAFGIFGIAALAGGALHATRGAGGSLETLWRPLYAVIGFAFALIFVGATSHWRGNRGMPPLVAPMALITGAYFALTWRIPNDELVLGVFTSVTIAAATIAFGLTAYGGAHVPPLARESRDAANPRDGAWMAAAGLLTFTAAGVFQISRPRVLVLGWTLDHNGISHLVVMPAIALLAWGVRDLLKPRG